jgi:hypothetical protein
MQALVSTDVSWSRSSAPCAQQCRTAQVLLSAEQVLHDSSVIEGVIEAIFERLSTTTVVVWVRRDPQDARP